MLKIAFNARALRYALTKWLPIGYSCNGCISGLSTTCWDLNLDQRVCRHHSGSGWKTGSKYLTPIPNALINVLEEEKDKYLFVLSTSSICYLDRSKIQKGCPWLCKSIVSKKTKAGGRVLSMSNREHAALSRLPPTGLPSVGVPTTIAYTRLPNDHFLFTGWVESNCMLDYKQNYGERRKVSYNWDDW